MNMRARQRGFLIIVGMILIAIGALVAVVATFLSVTRSESAGGHLGSTQALMIAQAGIERAVYEYRRGQACNSLSSASSGLGEGSFAVTATLYSTTAATLAAGGVSAGQQLIPVNSVAGYASHGRIRLDDEEINYTGVSTSAGLCGVVGSECFTGAIRGVNPTTAAAHAAGTAAYQNQCLIRSVGTATNTSTRRTIEANVPAWSGSAFYDGGSIPFSNTSVSIGSLTGTNMPAGTNLVIAVVAIRSVQTGGEKFVNPGDLQLRRGDSTPALVTNQYSVVYAGGGFPSGSIFPNETQFLLYKDTAAAANQSYSVWIRQSTTSTVSRAEMKILLINNPSLSDYIDGTGTTISDVSFSTLGSLSTTLPTGDYVVLAAVQIDNVTGGATRIDVGDLRLQRDGVTVAQNEFRIDVDDSGDANRGTGFLLMARLAGVPANATYTVVAQAVDTGASGDAKILVIGDQESAFVDSGSVAIGTTATTISTLLTNFPAGENVVIAANQYDNSASATRTVSENRETIVFDGMALAANQSSFAMCTSGTAVCDDFASGLLARQANASPNTSFAVEVAASGTGINGETKLMALHIQQELIDWVEIFQ